MAQGSQQDVTASHPDAPMGGKGPIVPLPAMMMGTMMEYVLFNLCTDPRDFIMVCHLPAHE